MLSTLLKGKLHMGSVTHTELWSFLGKKTGSV